MPAAKPRRPYNSTHRKAQARETRRQIEDAARGLFLERGYAGATMDAIALGAGVATETVYAVFGSKRKLLAHLVDAAVAGDEGRVPLLERTGPRAVLAETDPRRQLEMFAADITRIIERVAPLLEVVFMAATTEPDIRALKARILDGRWRNIAAVAERLADRSALRDGLDAARATDVLLMLTSAEVYLLLTRERGWSRDEYIAWLADSFVRLLLP